MIFIADFGRINTIIDLIFNILFLGAISAFICYYCKRKFILFASIIASVIVVVCNIFELKSSALIGLAGICILAIVALSANIGETRTLLDNKFTKSTTLKLKKRRKKDSTAYYSHEDFYKVIEKATIYLSNKKIGAIMTFEKNDNFDEICKNGTVLNAPVTFELLITIFYPGTRLHDGAVVIRDNIILAASVFYTPSTEMIDVKRGSRHRAAIGISSETDAVTVVVSEETGKISIAMDGELTSYSQDEFYAAFANIMESDVHQKGSVGE